MEAIRLASAEVTKEKRGSPAKDACGWGNSKKVLGEPTSAEVSRLTFEPLRDIRFSHQQMYNNFARLLNRGSSLE